MKKQHTFIIIAVLLFHLTTITNAQLAGAQKLIITITEQWESSTGMMILFDRAKNQWKKQRELFSVSVGENGLGWGEGLHPVQQTGRMKQEGDDRSPAGIFMLDTVFYGLAPAAPEGVRMPYASITELTRCVDDTASLYYNMIVDAKQVKNDWNSAEKMKKIVPDYAYVLVVKHNPKRIPGKGSCIFIHINNTFTSGCTAMNENDMLSLLHWLDPKRPTMVVQLPASEYLRLQHEWNLPDLQTEQ